MGYPLIMAVVQKYRLMSRAYEPLVSLNKAVLNLYFWGAYGRGGRLTSHELIIKVEDYIKHLYPTVHTSLKGVHFRMFWLTLAS